MDFTLNPTRCCFCSDQPTMGDRKLAKRIAMYLSVTKKLRLSMVGNGDDSNVLQVVGYSDADFAADKCDRKSVTVVQ